MNKKTNEKLQELNSYINENLNVIRFNEENIRANHTKCIVICNIHGRCDGWENPWTPTVSSLKGGTNCPKCKNKYRPTSKEVLDEINNLVLKKEIEVLGFVNNEYKSNKTKCIVKCNIHGIGEDWGTPWTPSVSSLKRGTSCHKCLNVYRYTKNEIINELNDSLNNKYKVLDLIGNKINVNTTKCIIECKIHGRGEDWGTPWTPTVSNLKKGKGCPKCKKTYKKTENEALEEINKILNNKIKVIGFVGEKYKTNKTKCIVKCKIHGIGDSWGTPWNPTYDSLLGGYGCPKCSNSYIMIKKEAISEINKKLKKIKVTGFINDKYIGTRTRCKVECELHGKSELWLNPWFPLYNDLQAKNNVNCIKCINQYKYSTEEARKILKLKFDNNNIKFIGFLGEDYKSNNTKCIFECKYHGINTSFGLPLPSYRTLITSSNACYKCAKENNELKGCIKKYKENNYYFEHFNFERNIYYIKFKNLKNNEIFYKIGVSSQGIKIRYKNSYIKKDFLEIIEAIEFKVSNYEALITEYSILKRFNKYRKSMHHVLKNCAGGSECFSIDITKKMDLVTMLHVSSRHSDKYLAELGLTTTEIENLKNNVTLSRGAYGVETWIEDKNK